MKLIPTALWDCLCGNFNSPRAQRCWNCGALRYHSQRTAPLPKTRGWFLHRTLYGLWLKRGIAIVVGLVIGFFITMGVMGLIAFCGIWFAALYQAFRHAYGG